MTFPKANLKTQPWHINFPGGFPFGGIYIDWNLKESSITWSGESKSAYLLVKSVSLLFHILQNWQPPLILGRMAGAWEGGGKEFATGGAIFCNCSFREIGGKFSLSKSQKWAKNDRKFKFQQTKMTEDCSRGFHFTILKTPLRIPTNLQVLYSGEKHGFVAKLILHLCFNEIASRRVTTSTNISLAIPHAQVFKDPAGRHPAVPRGGSGGPLLGCQSWGLKHGGPQA